MADTQSVAFSDTKRKEKKMTLENTNEVENQEIDFETIAVNSIEQSMDNMVASINNIMTANEAIEDSAFTKTSEVQDIYNQLVELENLGCNVHSAWRGIYDLMGWAYMIHDANLDSDVAVEGDKAPAKIATYKSESKAAFMHSGKENGEYTIKGHDTWQDMKKSYKKADDMVDLKTAMKNLFKVLRSIKQGKKDWIEYAIGEVNKVSIFITNETS
jgi:hypothetical protein